MRSLFVFILLCSGVLCPGVAAAQAPAAAREIERLFAALEHSDCQFFRNGAWYGPARASAHLRRKYDYLRDKGLVDSAETFIDLAASKSSMSGKPYLVRCGRTAPVESRAWFRGKLDEIRDSGMGAHAPSSPPSHLETKGRPV